MRYSIDQGFLRYPLEVEIEGVPPCLFCGEPVTSPSMDGPLVCGACDCGRNRGGSKWTETEAKERYAHRRSKVAEYRAQMIDRQLREMKELLAKTAGHVRYSSIETGECREEGGAADVAAFTAAARKLLPNLIERDALRGEEVAKWADACGRAKGAGDLLRREVAALRAALAEACDLAPQTDRVVELRALLVETPAPDVSAPRVADLPVDEVRIHEPRGISIDNGAAFGAVIQLRMSVRAAIAKASPEGIHKLRTFIGDRSALSALLADLPNLLEVYEEVAKLVKDEFVSYPLAKGGPWP